MARRRGERVPVLVMLGTLKYGFQTQKTTTTSYGTELGHVAYAPEAGVGVFFGANAPKPPKAKKVFTTGSVSSFCSTSKIDELRKADWEISNKSSRRGIKSAGLTRTVYVDMPGGYRYAWNITADDVDLGALLNFEQATASMNDLVWGSTPKPPRASKRENGTVTSTFCKPDVTTIEALVAAGWSVSGVSYDLIPAAAPGD